MLLRPKKQDWIMIKVAGYNFEFTKGAAQKYKGKCGQFSFGISRIRIS